MRYVDGELKRGGDGELKRALDVRYSEFSSQYGNHIQNAVGCFGTKRVSSMMEATIASTVLPMDSG